MLKADKISLNRILAYLNKEYKREETSMICYLQLDILQESFEHKLFSMQVSQRQDTVG